MIANPILAGRFNLTSKAYPKLKQLLAVGGPDNLPESVTFLFSYQSFGELLYIFI